MSDISLFSSPEWPYLILPVILGLVISALWVIPTLAWQWVRKGKGLTSIMRLGWLSTPWLILYPIGLVVSWSPLAALTPIATAVCAVAGVVLFKQQRANAVAVGLGNIIIALCCGAAQLIFSTH